MVQLFGNAHTVFTTPSMREQFSQLCLPAVEMWGKSDEVVTDSEATIVLLLDHYQRCVIVCVIVCVCARARVCVSVGKISCWRRVGQGALWFGVGVSIVHRCVHAGCATCELCLLLQRDSN